MPCAGESSGQGWCTRGSLSERAVTSYQEVGEKVEGADVEVGEEEIFECLDIDDLHEGIGSGLHAWRCH
jgi:hypothetical protein